MLYEDNGNSINNDSDSIQSLFMKVAHLYFMRTYQQLADTGIHPGQLPMLKLLGETDGLSQREISSRLHIKPPTVNVSLKRMESTGLIERRADVSDMRVTRIYMTDEGKALHEKITELIKHNEEALLKNFTESEKCLMKRFFHQFIKNLESIPVEGGGMPRFDRHCERRDNDRRKRRKD